MTQLPERPETPGSVHPTTAAVPVIAGCVGLVAGWAIRPLSLRMDTAVPMVSWMQVFVLLFVTAVVAGTALVTWRQLQVHRRWMAPHHAVNRLLLAKSCIVVGALLAGGYAGYVVSWLGIDSELAGERMLRAAVGMTLALALIGVAIWLERACRVPPEDDADLA